MSPHRNAILRYQFMIWYCNMTMQAEQEDGNAENRPVCNEQAVHALQDHS